MMQRNSDPDKKRVKHITLRVTKREADAIVKLAMDDDSISDYLRRLIREDAKRAVSLRDS